MKKLSTALIISVAINIFCAVGLLWLAAKNNGSIYDIPRTQANLVEFRKNNQSTYSKEFVENLIRLDLEADKAYRLKDEGIQDVAISVSMLLVLAAFIQIGMLIRVSKKAQLSDGD